MPKIKDPTERAIKARQSAHERIADGLRDEILRGKFGQGTQLPSTQELAATWDSSYFTLHTALRTLVKQGWVERRNGTGTFVADLRKRFLCAGIYHGVDVCEATQTAFPRNLHFALLKELTELGKDIQVFVDSRPENRQQKLFAPLAEAIDKRQIQCLIGVAINKYNRAELLRLSLPMAFMTDHIPRTRIQNDESVMLLEAVRSLKRQGCQTIGILATIYDKTKPFYRDFINAIEAEGLSTRPSWIREPNRAVDNAPLYGYAEFQKLWALREKPDGLIIWPDDAVKGAILAILRLGVEVLSRMRFVFHRNIGSPMLCPFPVTWAVVDEKLLAKAMIQMLEDQFCGKKIRPVFVPYRLEEDMAREWKAATPALNK